jgi:hypothetical protein
MCFALRASLRLFNFVPNKIVGHLSVLIFISGAQGNQKGNPVQFRISLILADWVLAG